jgi:lipoprotein-releasing system permease protein
MKLGVILSVSRTHLLARIKQTVTAALGVTFGIGTFIILMSFMTGLNQMLDGLVLDRTPHVHIYKQLVPTQVQPIEKAYPDAWHVVQSIKPKQTQKKLSNALPLISMLQNDERVKGVTAQVAAQVFYLSGTIELNGLINGVNILEEDRLFNVGDYIVAGSPQALKNSVNGIILGNGIAEKMSVGLGDRVQVVSPNGSLISLKVVGLYQSGLSEIDDVQSYTNLSTAQKILGEGSSYITDINVKLYDMELADEMAAELEANFDVTAVDIRTANAQFETGTDIRNLITYAVSITLLIVAGFGIYNILNMLIYEKMNDIAILKATGFSGSDVRLIFISEAILIGLIGGVLGLIVGYFCSVAIDNAPFETDALPTIKTFPVNFDPMYYVGGILFAMITTFFAGYLPAQKASKVDPVEIIRGQ